MPEEVGEVLEEEVGDNMKVTMYDPKSNRLFLPADDSDDTWNEQTPAFIGMTLTTNDSDDDDKTSELADEDVYDMDDGNFLT